ncbi:hypothetical protein FB559_1904 [Actinoallomurus bryophytorum]|uniref:Uncharacterized protein n=1 Tax=Actinoallomurus bryophytorum TaxID=1490222 RepID=A0A543CHH3_9ACTN|nr:hypothetical protein FB559_1904 [Actinoallomurus bryophytorum]
MRVTLGHRKWILYGGRGNFPICLPPDHQAMVNG